MDVLDNLVRIKELSLEPFNEAEFMKNLGVKGLKGEEGFTTLERRWARPTFEVNGLLSGFTGEGAKTVLPAVAMAKVSMRLVPDQHPDRIAQQFEECAAGAAHDHVAELRIEQPADEHLDAVPDLRLHEHLRDVGPAGQCVEGPTHGVLAPEADVHRLRLRLVQQRGAGALQHHRVARVCSRGQRAVSGDDAGDRRGVDPARLEHTLGLGQILLVMGFHR